jgi:CheY-like chemotaxis protein
MTMADWKDPKTWTVLLVDDERDNVEVVAESLEFYGAKVKTAGNGQQGMELLTANEFAPTFILLDLSMPVMDGWKMHKLLKENPRVKDIPVIALSAHAMSGDKERVLEAGFDGYLPKPVSVADLVQNICEWLECRKEPSA